jgi:hypothetical protein
MVAKKWFKKNKQIFFVEKKQRISVQPLEVALVFFILGFFFCFQSFSQVLFEGYYRILINKEPVGYSIQRYESLKEGKIFKATVFLKTNSQGGNITESIVTESDSHMNPLKLSYIAILGQETKIIEASVHNGFLLVDKGGSPLGQPAGKSSGQGRSNSRSSSRSSSSSGGPSGGSSSKKSGHIASHSTGNSQEKIKIEPGVFFSGILIYSILKAPQGLSPETQYQYKALVEESLQVEEGQAHVQGYDQFRGRIKSLKVLNSFQDTKFYSWVTEKGEVLETTAPLQGLVTELMPSAQEATKDQVVPEKVLKALFGEIPKGHSNIAYRSHQKGEWPTGPLGSSLEKSLDKRMEKPLEKSLEKSVLTKAKKDQKTEKD